MKDIESDVDELITRYKSATTKRNEIVNGKMKVEAELAARKRALKEAMEACKKEGFNPDTLHEDLKKMKEVLALKIDVYVADLKAAEEQLMPMIKEIGLFPMPYGHGEWEFDLFRQAREFIRLHAVISGEASEISEAREMCKQFTHLIEDDWEFDKHTLLPHSSSGSQD